MTGALDIGVSIYRPGAYRSSVTEARAGLRHGAAATRTSCLRADAESHARGPRRADSARLLASYPQRWLVNEAPSHARTVPTDAPPREKAGGSHHRAIAHGHDPPTARRPSENGGLVRVWYGVYAAQELTCWAAWRPSMCSWGHAVACLGTGPPQAVGGFDTENTVAIHMLDPGVRMWPTVGLMVHNAPVPGSNGCQVVPATAPAWDCRGRSHDSRAARGAGHPRRRTTVNAPRSQ